MTDDDDDDPLDAAGRLRTYSAGRTAWAAVWSRFPMYADKPKLRSLVASLRGNGVTIVVSGTGSGKTVVCPPLALSLLPPGARVGVTIPKRVTALGAATTAARTLDATLGREVGYRYRGAPAGSYDRQHTRLVYATDGTLLAQARHDPLLREYAAVVVDEAHERSVSTDMLLLSLRHCLAARPEFRVVVMSATIDPALFSSYFASAGRTVGLVEVAGGTMYPVQRVFARVDSTPEGYVADGIALAAKLLSSSSSLPSPPGKKAGINRRMTTKAKASGKDEGNALFFVATTREAGQGCRAFRKVCAKGCDAVDCAGLYSKQSADVQAAALAPVASPFERKLMFATNVAESSLTFHELTTVVDGGFELTSTWNPMAHGSRIEKARITRAQALQRIGRVGRTSPGVAHLLYTNATFDALPAYPKPSILVIDLTEHVLSAVAVKGSPGLAAALADFGAMITPPSAAQLAAAVSLLHFYRLLDVWRRPATKPTGPKGGDGKGREGNGHEGATPVSFKEVPYGKPEEALAGLDGRVTAHGLLLDRVMARLKMGLWNALLAVAGAAYGCADEAGTLASMFEATGGELSSLFLQDDGKKKDMRRAFPAAADAASDHSSLLNVYRTTYLPIVSDEGRSKEGRSKSSRVAVAKAGLAYGPWRAVHERVKADARAIAHITVPREVVAACPLYRLRTPGGALMHALAAARMYHHVSAAGMTTATPERFRCPAEPDFAAPKKHGAALVYEQLMESGGRRRLLTVTWLA
jgi:HrpA-like RNA helicase